MKNFLFAITLLVASNSTFPMDKPEQKILKIKKYNLSNPDNEKYTVLQQLMHDGNLIATASYYRIGSNYFKMSMAKSKKKNIKKPPRQLTKCIKKQEFEKIRNLFIKQ